MKIKLVIATCDSDYAEHLSNVLSEKFADEFSISVCSLDDELSEILGKVKFDAALIELQFTKPEKLSMVRLPIILYDESDNVPDEYECFVKIRKYQKISSIAGEVLQAYAETTASASGPGINKANVTACWSPSGGVGKTTVALAYAARRVLDGKQVVYLNLENFSSIPIFFSNTGKSISTAFEKLDSNINMFLMGIRQKDSGSGISYFCGPDNYDDIHILTADDVEKIIEACAFGTDELVIDLSCYCGECTKKALELADSVMLVCDHTRISQAKLKQFINQHNIFKSIQAKSILINNKGAEVEEASALKSIKLSHVPSTDPVFVYKTLSGNRFEW